MSKKDRKRVAFFKKSVLLAFIIVIPFLITAEVAQRIRYVFRFHSSYWLCYGFINPPGDYREMHWKGINQAESLDPRLIDGTPMISFGQGKNRYLKYNPHYSGEGQINSLGFRNKEFNIKKKKGMYRIVALGSSTTFGQGAADGFTYPEFLEKKLNLYASGKIYEVINTGISGTIIAHVDNLFKNEVINWDVDMIVINNVFNNLFLSDLAHEIVNRNGAISLRTIDLFLLTKSILYMTLREKLYSFINPRIDNIYTPELPVSRILKNFLTDDAFWQELENIYMDIIGIAKAHNIKVILVTEPVKLGVSEKKKMGNMLDERTAPIYKKAYSLLYRIADKEDLDLVDVAYYFNQSAQENAYFTDGVHLTIKGNEYLAQLIAEKMINIRDSKPVVKN